MRQLSEAFKINKDTANKLYDKKYDITVCDSQEDLFKVIKERYADNPHHLNLTNIDISKLNSFDLTLLFYIDDTITPKQYNKFDNVETIDVTGWKIKNITYLGGAFAGFKNLKRITGLDTWDVSEVTSFSSMFFMCDSLTDIGDISQWDVRKLTNATSMFKSCKSLKEVDLSGWDPQNLAKTPHMFEDCFSLEECKGVDDWKKYEIPYYLHMFKHCYKLKTNVNWAM